MRSQLKEGEQVIIEARKTWLIMVPVAMVFLFTILLTPKLGMMGIVFSVLAAAFVLYMWFVRELTVLVVTTDRLVDESGVLALNVRECNLDKVNNVDVNQNVFARMLGYGRISVQTAAEQGEIPLTTVADPRTVKREILTAIDRYRKSIRKAEMAELAEAIGCKLQPGSNAPEAENNGRQARDAMSGVLKEHGVVPTNKMIDDILRTAHANRVTAGKESLS